MATSTIHRILVPLNHGVDDSWESLNQVLRGLSRELNDEGRNSKHHEHPERNPGELRVTSNQRPFEEQEYDRKADHWYVIECEMNMSPGHNNPLSE